MLNQSKSMGHTLWRAVTSTGAKPLDKSADAYLPLLAGWLLQLALQLRWTRPGPRGKLPDALADDDFLALTGLLIEADEDDDAEVDDDYRPHSGSRSRKRWREAELARLVKARLKDVCDDGWSPDQPLLDNIRLLTDLVGGGVADQAVLLFAAVLSIFQQFKQAVVMSSVKTSNQELARIVAGLSGQPADALHAALQPGAPLVASGILRVIEGLQDWEDKLDLMSGVMVKSNRTLVQATLL